MMYEKCTLGYLTKRKKAEILWIVFFVVLGVAIFLTGYLWSGVRANIFTEWQCYSCFRRRNIWLR